ncbi:MAG: antitoxin Xre/MbcA/ParS toxin-binding domain-containing protein [Cyclobacteriaceae bacterium]
MKNSNQELKKYIKEMPRAQLLQEPAITYGNVLQDKMLVARAVKQGVTGLLFEEIKSNSPFSEQQWSYFLNINIRTMQRYKSNHSHIFKPIQSERIFELAEVVNTGDKVFDSRENFNIWLNSPSLALGNEKPIDLLDSSYGKDLVLAELHRIEHGVFI